MLMRYSDNRKKGEIKGVDTLQIAILIGLVVMACVSFASIAWAFYLDGKYRNRPAPKHYSVHVEGVNVFSEQDLAAAREEARAGFRKAVAGSVSSVQPALAASISNISAKTEEMAKITLSQEFEKYQSSFAALREETIKEFGELQNQLDKRRDQLVIDMDAQYKKQQEARIDSFNERIAEVVSSYLVEALDKGVDLGAQSKYIIHTLEAHKEDIKKDILS